jgi:hypothetical protein
MPRVSKTTLPPDIFSISLSQEVEKAEPLPNTASAKNNNKLLGVELPVTPELGVKFFDWKQFRETPDSFSHIRAVGATNSEKRRWLIG